MLYKELGQDHRHHTYVDETPLSFHRRYCYKEFRKWEDRMDELFDGDYYFEHEKVNIAARTFDNDVFAGGMN